ncbi:hypothetical protein PAXRUDRAFT_835932 [Paxillus rubicundulus Ve08.2h10]|uniref:HNH nuclease domain-containing protein n=1 Tax=Paxillus rubicundulus Ve08.2h10 TaxID=930991 RepID=A0A0D0BT73_9AGAM|nr:hypothetical protein PAXRUDRAFT_835932 [Paxillus rubicundulus Ve08.2h10]
MQSNEKEMNSRPLAPYPLALLQLMIREEASAENLPLGTATRVGVERSAYNVPAHHFLEALIRHAPSPDTIAREFLVELGRCRILVVESLAEAVCNRTCTDPPDDWAVTVRQQLQEPGADITKLTELTNHYFSYLVIAFLHFQVRDPGGKKTPQDTVHPTPNLRCIEEIEELLSAATTRRSQSALKDLVTLRDGVNCLLTGFSFVFPRRVIARCAHIIPFSVGTKTQTHSAIEAFTGHKLDAKFIQKYINHPRNALNLQNDAHDSMDKDLAWGIEANFSDNQWKYYYRIVRPYAVSPVINLTDGEQIAFGNGTSGSGRSVVPLPDPMISNLHLAVARVSYASGASEVFDRFLDDDNENACDVPVYFGGPFMSDDVLMRRLEVLACY